MIKVLAKNISDKIAAGEVIERPLSIVKELVENSVDAGADHITCEIRNGGKTFIRVTDNGCGIPAGEAETAFLRHATSKITSVRDLTRIASLGFRGEALASIAAVTRTTLITKTADSKAGCRITIHGGEVIENAAVGCPDGTTMIVTDLFYNTPARREFLKNDGAESSVIIDFLSEMALAYPKIRFQLINGGSMLFSTSGDGNRRNTILSVYHRKEYEDLVPLQYSEEGISVTGMISRPSLSRSTRRDQIYFVNGRVVRSKVMEKGVSEGYRERLFEGRYPVVFLFLQVDPETLDVNIHPNKREVRFHDDKAVTLAIRSAVAQALASDDAVVEARDYFIRPQEQKEQSRPARPKDGTVQVDIKSLLSTKRQEMEVRENTVPVYRAERPEVTPAPEQPVSQPVSDPEPAKVLPESEATMQNPVPPKAGITLQEPVLKPFDFNDLNVKGSIFDTYITATDGDHFYMIDQHAAQERIFYEKLVGEYMADDKPSQTILTPFTIDVSLSLKEESFDWFQSLTEMGYRLEEFGPNTYLVKEIPYFMEIGEAEDFLRDYVDQVREGTDLGNTVVINKLITRSCKAAIKAHDRLSEREIQALIRDLAQCRNPFSCPHGRPTFIRFSNYDIEKMFKRA